MKSINFQIDDDDAYKRFKSINAKKGMKGKDVWTRLLNVYLKNPSIIE